MSVHRNYELIQLFQEQLGRARAQKLNRLLQSARISALPMTLQSLVDQVVQAVERNVDAKRLSRSVNALYLDITTYAMQALKQDQSTNDAEIRNNVDKLAAYGVPAVRAIKLLDRFYNDVESVLRYVQGSSGVDEKEESDEEFEMESSNNNGVACLSLAENSAFIRVIPQPFKISVTSIPSFSMSMPRQVQVLRDDAVPTYRKLSHTTVCPKTKNGTFPISAASLSTIGLLQTYRVINQKYYQSKQNETIVETKAISNGDILNSRYVVGKVLGSGSFGTVYEAIDNQTSTAVALKILNSLHGAENEFQIISSLNRYDPLSQFGIVQLLDSFQVENHHQVFVFELMSMSLYDIIRNTSYLGCSLHLVRKFGKQLLQTLEFLRNPSRMNDGSAGVIHCDLKPENILLCNKRRAQIKLIDFGSACRSNQSRMFTYIQSRFYRAPEVLLGLPYSFPIDMWSLGCVLVELHTGKPLFDGQTEAEQVAKIVATLGVPPDYILAQAERSSHFFRKLTTPGQEGYVLLPPKTLGVSGTFPFNPLHVILGVNSNGPEGRRANEKSGHTRTDYLAFYELISRMLDFNPETRITPAEALSHPFFVSDVQVQADVKPDASVMRPARLVSLAQNLNKALHAFAAATKDAHESKEDMEVDTKSNQPTPTFNSSKMGRLPSFHSRFPSAPVHANQDKKSVIPINRSRFISRRVRTRAPKKILKRKLHEK